MIGGPADLMKPPEQVTCAVLGRATSLWVPFSAEVDAYKPSELGFRVKWEYTDLPESIFANTRRVLIRPAFWDPCLRLRIRLGGDTADRFVFDQNAFVFSPGAVEVVVPEAGPLFIAFGLDEDYVKQSCGIPTFTMGLRSVLVALWEKP